MKKIRIKISTIVILIIIVIGISIVPTIFKGNISYFIGNIYESLGKHDIADTYYKKVIDSNNNDKLSVEAAIKRLENVLSEKDLSYMKMVTFYDGYVSSGAIIAIESLEKINEEYYRITNNIEKDDRVALYEIYVSMMNWFSGEKEKAINIIEDINYIQDDELEIYRELNISAMKIVLAEYEEAEELLYSSLRNNKFNKYKQVMLALIYSMRGEDAAQILKYEPQNLSYKDGQITSIINEDNYNNINEIKTEYISSVYDNFIEAEHFMKEDKKFKNNGTASIKGKVTCNNEPLRGVIVYLKDDSGFSAGGIFSDLEWCNYSYGITDVNGEYTITNIDSGDYGLAINISWQDINGKIIKKSLNNSFKIKNHTTLQENIEIFDAPKISSIEYIDDNRIKLQWENAEEVIEVPWIQAKMLIKNDDGEANPILNAHMYVEIDEQKDNYAIINIRKTIEKLEGRISGWSMGEKVDPYQLFEAFYIGGDYTFELNFKYNDDYEYIGAYSGGIYPKKEIIKINVKGEKLSEGDNLILNKDYEEAIKWFEKSVQKNPEDIHALKMLSAIYKGGYLMKYEDEDKDKDNMNRETDHIGQDLNKALKYTEKLVELHENEIILTRLENIYSELGMREKAFEIEQKLVEKYDSYYNYRYISRYYIRKGDMVKGYETIKLFHDKEDSKYEDFSDIIMMSIIFNDKNQLQNLIPFAKYRFSIDSSEELQCYLGMNNYNYKDFFINLNNNKYEEAVKILENDDTNLGVFYRGIIILLKREEGYRKEYSVLYKQQSDDKLKTIMKYFGQCEISSGFGDELY